MSNKVIPSKFVASKLRIGADTFKDIQVERVRLQPVGVNSSTVYTPTSLNKIHFRLPSYSMAFQDNSRSYLSFTAKVTSSGTINNLNNGVFGNGLPIFNRVVIKSSDGLVIEDITQYHILQRLFTITSAEEDYRVHEGIYGTDDPLLAVGAQMIPAASGIVYTMQFNTGILSKDLSSYLPVFMMNGNGGYCLDIELYLSPANDCMKQYGTGNADMSYSINEPIWNACLLRMDASLCAKFNEIACSANEKISIPFTTYRTHVGTLTSQTNIVHINEAATNLKRIFSVYTNTTQNKSGTVLPFLGSVNSTNGKRLTSYNYKIGTKYLYNEFVQETINNNVTLNYVKDSMWSQDKPMILSKTNSTKNGTLFEDATSAMFMTVANMTYSPEEMKEVVQGISSVNPIQLEVKFDTTPTSAVLVHNFCELGYNLTVQGGLVRFEEQRPGSQSVY